MIQIKEKLPPEIQVESVMSYTSQAADVLKESPVDIKKGDYRLMLMADGPHYYTGILQTMGYLLIDKIFPNKKNLIIFNETSAKNKLYLLEEGISYLGRSRKKQKSISDIIKKFDFVKKLNKDNIETEKKQLQNKIRAQINFIRVLNPHHELARGTIGPSFSTKNLKSLLEDPQLKDYNIIFVGALHSQLGNTECMEKDKELISNMLLGENLNDYKKEFPHIYYFSHASKSSKKTDKKQENGDTEILAYLNSSQLGAEENNCTGYACIIA